MNTIIDSIEMKSIWELIPYHKPCDTTALAELTSDMSVRGWVGTPLVRFDDKLMTGSHRYQAALDAGMTEVPVVNYMDVFTVDESEATEIVRNSPNDYWVVELTELALDSDPEIAKELGMDAH